MIPPVIDPAGVIRDALEQRTTAPRTQTQLARAIDLTWRQWTERMRGNVPWRADELGRVSRVLDVPLTALIAGPKAEKK